MLAAALLLIALVGHAALWIGAVNRLHAIGLPKLWKELATAAAFACLFAAPPLVAWRWWSLGSGAPVGVVDGGGPLGVYLALCVPLAGCVAAARLWRQFGGEQSGVIAGHTQRVVDLGADGGRDALVHGRAARALAGLPGNELLRLTVEEKTLRVPGLPAELDGLRIAHLSDLHMSGRIGVGYYARAVELANEWRPDLTALTGDLVENTACLDWVAPTLGELTAPRGVYFVLGNHDDHGDAVGLRRRLAEHGHVDLGGRWVDLDVDGATLRLAGNELPWFSPAADLASAPPTAAATFALVHGPDQFSWARRHGVSLVLAGHNHGGQIRFPLIGPIVAPSLSGVRHASGAFRRGSTVLHVTRGVGALAPVRWNCPPELALLTLARA